MIINDINKKVNNTPDNIKQEFDEIKTNIDEKINELSENIDEIYTKADNAEEQANHVSEVIYGELMPYYIVHESAIDYLIPKAEEFEYDINSLYMSMEEKVDKTGGQFEGIIKAQSNEEYTTAQMRNVILSTDDPDNSLGNNGDIWIKYK